ncbi:MAG: hypothetical protein UV59_C0040G0013 [Candidatus Gottesmanbacteria bacterium GW2011_GWA1_43_11]|uniref:Uncharacterized protein n=1 Tax=Candidatus Gottesmanbacteria bacterium GW2011_GWA1_43_11 TaxID=1618436 RepID=A0A0G1EK48_9BACT|nr:MAG: hypothetical protein UV59_C0040G0013 [Candidatus Gottesmanbacteria bacterium GW2011_GWA1_43_11]
MSETKIAISSLAMDLKRVALGYWKGSDQTALRFSNEALKRQTELNSHKMKPYIQDLLKKLPQTLDQKDKQKLAEDALMLSTLFQNYALKID